MADIIYAYADGADLDSNTVRVAIYGPDDSRSAVEFTAGFPLCTIKWRRDESGIYTDPFMVGEADINFLIETTAQDTLIREIANSAENTFSVQITVEGVRYWTGMIIPDTLSIELDCEPSNVNIRATDGLTNLKNYNNHDINYEYIYNFFTIMGQLKNWQFYPSNASSVFFNPQFIVDGSAKQVFQDVFFERQFDNDYEYLAAILNDTGCFMVQTNGYWYIIGLLNWAGGSLSGTWYKEDSLAAVSSTTLNYSTIDVNLDVGGIRRFTRPFEGVASAFDESGDIQATQNYSGTTAHSPAVWTYTETVISKTVDPVSLGYELEIQYWAEMQKNTGSSSHFNRFNWKVQFGTKYYNAATNAWNTTSSNIAHFDNVAGDSNSTIYVIGSFKVPLSAAGYNTAQTLTITLDFTQANSGVTVITNTAYNTSFIGNDLQNTEYQTGTTLPHMEIKHYFSGGNGLTGDMLYSGYLADYVGNNWSWPSGIGAPTGYLHELRADAIAARIDEAESLFECRIDNMDGPINFYRITKGRKLVAIHFEQDMQRREGSILGLLTA